MNENEKRETLADIVAEMRRGTKLPGYWRSCDLNKILECHADRIEAAWKREKAEAEADALAVGGTVEASRNKPVGNAAKMREAVVALLDALDSLGCDESTATLAAFVPDMADSSARCLAAFRKANAAISAPARNCDIYSDAREAFKAYEEAFNESNFHHGECKLGCPDCDDYAIRCEIKWLFAPAAEEGEGDGR